MNDQKESVFSKFATSPLGIISMFVALVESVLAVAVFKTTGGIQIALTTFVLGFPLLIGAAFFYILWNRPYVLYGPGEYSDQTKVGEFVEAMQAKVEIRNEIETIKAPPAQAVALSPADDSASHSLSISTELEVKGDQNRDWFEAAGVAIHKGDFETAFELGKARFSGVPEQTRMLAWWAYHLYGKGWSKGFQTLKDFSLQNSEEAFSWLALIHLDAGQWTEAISSYEKARALADSNKEKLSYSILIAKALVSAGTPDDALNILRDLVAGGYDPPEQAQIYKALGELLLKIYSSQPSLGISCYEKALLIHPGDIDLRFDIAYSHSSVITTSGSFYHYRKLVQLKSDHDMAKNNAGWAAEELDLPMTSVDYFKSSTDQKNTLAMSNLGRLLLDAGFEKEAKDVLEKARSEPSPHSNVDEWLGKISLNRRMEERKIEELEERIEKSLQWRKSEAEAIAQRQFPVGELVGMYIDAKGNVLTIALTDELEISAEMIKPDQILSLSGHIFGSLFTFTWKTTPSPNIPTPSPRSLLSLGLAMGSSENGTGALIIQQGGLVLYGYRAKADEPHTRTVWNLTRQENDEG